MNKASRTSKPFQTLFGIIFLLIYSHTSWGQIATLELGTTSYTSNSTGAVNFTSKDANIVSLPATTLTIGQQGQAGGAGYIASKNWGTTATINTNMYYQFTLTASSGYSIAVTQLSLRMYRSSTGPASIALSSDADSYATQIGGVQTLGSATNSTISFSSLTLTGKSSITFRIYGYNASAGTGTLRIGDGTASSSDISVVGTVSSTGNTIPTLSSPTATSITTTSAILGATVTSNGGDPLNDRGTLWGTSSSPTGNSVSEGGTSVAAFSHSRSGLTPNTLYTYRGYATNLIGTSYSSDGIFTTLPNAPSVGSGSAATQSSFTANWTAPSGGSAAFTYQIQVSTDITFTTPNADISTIASTNLSQNISTGLSAGTTYYYRVRATNATGNSTWSTTSAGITTSAATAPIISSPTATTIANTTATLGGNITNLGGTSLTGNGIVWSVSSTNANPTIGAIGCTQVTGNATATGAFTINVSGLPTGTALSYSAYATNSMGTTYSNLGTFTTLVAASKLAFGTAPPSTGAVGSNLTSFTVQALRPDNTIDSSYIGNITIVKTSGTGNLLGTLTTAATAGIATFSGVQFDSAGTYTVNATSGSLTQSVASGNIVINISTVASNSYRTTSSGTWSGATWERFISGSWTSNAAPSTSTTNTVYIRHAITSGGSITPSTIVIESGSLTYTAASSCASSMTVKSGATLQIDAALNFTGATVTVESGGIFNINYSSASGVTTLWSGTEDFQSGSTVNIQNWSYSSGSGDNRLIQNPTIISANSAGYYFGNLTISGTPTALFSVVEGAQTNVKVCQNNFTVSNTAQVVSLLNTSGASCIIGGDVIANSAGTSFAFSSSNGTVTTTINGNLTGTGPINLCTQAGGQTSIVQLKGNLLIPASTTLSCTSNVGTIVFSGTSGTQTISVSATATLGDRVSFEIGDATNASTVQLINQNLSLTNAGNLLTVRINSILDFNYRNITGLGIFTLDAGGTIRITDAGGVYALGTNIGNVLNTGGRTFSQSGIYHYIGNVTPQSTGNAMTSGSTAKRIIIDKTNPSDIVNLTQSTSTTDRLEVIQGTFVETALANIAGSGALTMSGGTYKTAVISPAVVPQLSGTYSLAGGTIELNAAGAQILNGVPSYNNITFSNSGTKTLSSSISTINGTVTIKDTAIVDTGSSTFGGTGTNLTMTGTSRLIVSGARTLPDMTGTYSLIGGTIEFAGNSAYHAAKSPITYNNVLISGNNVNGGSGNYTLNNGGTFTVNSSATFNATDQRIIAGGASASIIINGTFNTTNSNGFSGSTTTSISPTNTNITLGATSTIQYSRTTAQAVSTRTDYANLSIINAGIKSISGAIGLSGNLNIGSGSTLNANTFVISPSGLSVVTIDGTLQTANPNGLSGTNNTTLNGNSFYTVFTNSTIEYNGSNSQILSSRSDYNNIIVNNSSGLVLNGACTLNGNLNLTIGTVTLGSYNLTLGNSSAIIVTSPDVTKMIIANGIGQLKKMLTANSTFTFPIGDTTGTADYSPITISTLGSSYAGASISVSVSDDKHPNNNSNTNFLTRYWTVSQSGITDCTLTLNGTYTNSDISGNANNIKAAQLAGIFNQVTNPWIKIGGNLMTANTLTYSSAVLASGQSSFFTGIASSDPLITSINDRSVCKNDSVTLTATVTGDGPYTYSWSGLITGSTTTESVTASTSIPGGPNLYTVTVKDANGISANSSTNITVDSKNIWLGTTSGEWTNPSNWSCGFIPDATTDIVISSGANPPLITNNLTLNSITIETGASFVIPSGFTVTAINFVHNNGTMTIANNANLIQINEVSPSNVNTGSITVNRSSAPLLRLDHTLWSSPLAGTQKLKEFSPNTLQNRFYTYATSSNSYVNVPNPTNTDTDPSLTNNFVFTAGKGYAIRASNNHSSTVASPFEGIFTGIPNNGTIPFDLDYSGLGFNLIGNPYPSAIAADLVISNNENNIEGTIYFYAHSLTMSPSGTFNGSNYSTWNATGHALAGHEINDPHPLPEIPNGIIQVGQGFFVKAKNTGNGAFNFKNSMRIETTSSQFFRTSPIEKHRLWLNLKTGSGSVLNQILIGYIEGASQEVDSKFDGLAFGNSVSALSSKIGTSNYTIQGRSLPFNSSDVVPLGFKAVAAGNFSITLTETDGLFSGNQDIFIRDNALGIYHNIKVSPYSFASEVGTFDSRFELVYTQALGIPLTDFTPNSVVVYKNTDGFLVNTKGIIMKEIHVYDISGRLINKQLNINTTKTALKGLPDTNEVLFVKITSQDNITITVKVIGH